jgi:competence protein ComGC
MVLLAIDCSYQHCYTYTTEIILVILIISFLLTLMCYGLTKRLLEKLELKYP